MDKATPRPWVMRQALSPVDGAYDYAISSNDVRVLAEAFGRSSTGAFIDAKANAALIVKAVNSHDVLVEALESVVKRSPFKPTAEGLEVSLTFQQVKQIQSVLKSAKGEA